MKSKGPPNPMSREGVYIVGIGGSSIGNAFGAGSNVINIGGDNYGQVGVTLTNCINMILEESDDDRRALLEALNRDVRRLIENLPKDKQDEGPQIAENLEMLVKQATSDRPNRKWYSVSAESLLEAATWVKEFTGNIAGTLSNLGKSIWPDFEMPASK